MPATPAEPFPAPPSTPQARAEIAQFIINADRKARNREVGALKSQPGRLARPQIAEGISKMAGLRITTIGAARLALNCQTTASLSACSKSFGGRILG